MAILPSSKIRNKAYLIGTKRSVKALKTKSDKIDMMLGENLRILRRRAGMTQGQVAKKLGVSCQQLHKYESGSNRIAASTLYFLSKTLKVPIIEFFRGIERTHHHESFSHEEIEWLRLFKALPSGGTRKDILRQMKTLADSDRTA